jgi:hypothetical protein
MIHSTNIYQRLTVAGTVLTAKETVVNQTDKISAPPRWGFYFRDDYK